MNWKILSSKYISQHQYFTARQDRCEMPDGQIVDAYFVVELPESVCAMAVTENNEVILAKQYRHPISETLLEIPGGFIDQGESPDTAIERELLEETGYAFTKFDYLGKVAANPGALNNYTHLYLARGGKKISAQALDHNEEIEVHQTRSIAGKAPGFLPYDRFFQLPYIQALFRGCVHCGCG